nr:hypothetical protein CFP56_13668 [Quercus suber]
MAVRTICDDLEVIIADSDHSRRSRSRHHRPTTLCLPLLADSPPFAVAFVWNWTCSVRSIQPVKAIATKIPPTVPRLRTGGKTRIGINGGNVLVKNMGKERDLSDGKKMEKVEPTKKKGTKYNKHQTDDLETGLSETIAEKPRDKSKGIEINEFVGSGCNAHSSSNETRKRNTRAVSTEDGNKEMKKMKMAKSNTLEMYVENDGTRWTHW